MLKVLGRSSSINVRKVLWTCTELGLTFEQEHWGSPSMPLDTPAFKALNPNAMVPVLIDDDVVLWESNTICRYLAGRSGRADLLPSVPRERAQVETWMDWQATELNNAWRYPFMALVRHSPAHRDPAAISAGVQAWNRLMGMVEDRLAHTGAYMAGSTFTLADIAIGVSTHRWLASPIERPVLPAVDRYYARLGERPGYGLHVLGDVP